MKVIGHPLDLDSHICKTASSIFSFPGAATISIFDHRVAVDVATFLQYLQVELGWKTVPNVGPASSRKIEATTSGGSRLTGDKRPL